MSPDGEVGVGVGFGVDVRVGEGLGVGDDVAVGRGVVRRVAVGLALRLAGAGAEVGRADDETGEALGAGVDARAEGVADPLWCGGSDAGAVGVALVG